MPTDVRMVDVSHKEEVIRIATAVGRIRLRRETLKRILEGRVEKGDVISATKLVAIAAAKRTWDLLPLCHPIPVTHIECDIRPFDDGEACGLEVEVTVKTSAKTGCEMEAIVACALALANIWDFVKKYEKDERGQYPTTEIVSVRVIRKEKRVPER